MLALERQESGAVDYEWMALWLGGGLLLAAWTFPLWGEFYPFACPLKALSGIPCAFCGGTRAAAAFAQGRFFEALTLNPLVGIGCGLALTYFLYALFSVATRQSRRLRFIGFAAGASARMKWALRAGIAGAILTNWVYLVAVGR
jgi:hypothetical protein